MSEIKVRVCPVCGRNYSDPPALSRADNTTDICPDCGMMEALASIPRPHEGPAERTRRPYTLQATNGPQIILTPHMVERIG